MDALLVLLAWAELVWLLQKDFNHLAFPNSYIVAIQKRAHMRNVKEITNIIPK
jgi:hypothetical protein